MNTVGEKNLLEEDLDDILNNTKDLWEELRGQRIFITGGTGFFGTWLLESFAWANKRLELNAEAMVLSRDPDAFCHKAVHLAENKSIKFNRGDVCDFTFPDGFFSHIIHAATASSLKQNNEEPITMLDTIVQGTRHTLDFAQYCRAKKFLITSSGAVYGKQPPDLTHVSETYSGATDILNPQSAYGEGKRMAELLCSIYAKQYGIETKIARCFAFVGPYLPLDIHFAIGNFIRDGIVGRPIMVKGDGTPYRSYLYVSDLVIWLWTILFQGKTCWPYNVGSQQAINIADVANLVSASFHPAPEIQITHKPDISKASERYVPSTQRALIELNLQQRIPLPEAISRTVHWHKEVRPQYS